MKRISKKKKREMVIEVLKENALMHIENMRSAEKSAALFTDELIKFIRIGRLSKKTRGFVENEIKEAQGTD